MKITEADITGELRLNFVQVAIMRLRYFTVYLGHKQYYELRSNVDCPKYVNIDHTGSEILFGRIFVILVNSENYYHFTAGKDNV